MGRRGKYREVKTKIIQQLLESGPLTVSELFEKMSGTVTFKSRGDETFEDGKSLSKNDVYFHFFDRKNGLLGTEEKPGVIVEVEGQKGTYKKKYTLNLKTIRGLTETVQVIPDSEEGTSVLKGILTREIVLPLITDRSSLLSIVRLLYKDQEMAHRLNVSLSHAYYISVQLLNLFQNYERTEKAYRMVESQKIESIEETVNTILEAYQYDAFLDNVLLSLEYRAPQTLTHEMLSPSSYHFKVHELGIMNRYGEKDVADEIIARESGYPIETIRRIRDDLREAIRRFRDDLIDPAFSGSIGRQHYTEYNSNKKIELKKGLIERIERADAVVTKIKQIHIDLIPSLDKKSLSPWLKTLYGKGLEKIPNENLPTQSSEKLLTHMVLDMTIRGSGSNMYIAELRKDKVEEYIDNAGKNKHPWQRWKERKLQKRILTENIKVEEYNHRSR